MPRTLILAVVAGLATAVVGTPAWAGVEVSSDDRRDSSLITYNHDAETPGDFVESVTRAPRHRIADIVRFRTAYDGDSVVMSLRTRRANADPHSQVQGGFQIVDGAGDRYALSFRVHRKQPRFDFYGADGHESVCNDGEVTLSESGRRYVARVPASCVGDPVSVRTGAVLGYAVFRKPSRNWIDLARTSRLWRPDHEKLPLGPEVLP